MTHLGRSKISRASASAVPPAVGAGTGFSVSARKTIAAPATAVYGAWIDARKRAHWLKGVELKVRQANAPELLRLTCSDDESDIAVTITAGAKSQCKVRVDHTNLASAQMVAERRHCWKEMLRALKHDVESAQEPVGLRPPRS
jgi:uncharacterized protein YndB with AHSA1/START domain